MLLNNFGSSESGFNGTATDDSGPERGFRVRVNARTQVVDPATHEPVAVGEVGRVAQCGHVPLGYYNDPAKTAETFFEKGGERWVLLGDMATVDEERRRHRPRPRLAVHQHRAARRCIRRRSSRPSSPIRTCTTRWWPGCRTRSGAAMWRPWCSCARARRRCPWTTSRRTAATRLAGYKIPRQLVLARAIRRSPSGKADYRWAQAVAAEADQAG